MVAHIIHDQSDLQVVVSEPVVLQGWLFLEPTRRQSNGDLIATTEPGIRYQYQWYSQDIDLNDKSIFLSSPKAAVMVIKSNALRPASTYTLNCTVVDTTTNTLGMNHRHTHCSSFVDEFKQGGLPSVL